MATIIDAELEQRLIKIKECKKTSNKLVNYKKAIERLDEMKQEYNDLCKSLESNKKSKSKSNLSIEKIISRLEEINDKFDDDNNDMLELVSSYIECRALINNLEFETDHIKNEIYKIDQSKKKIIVEKIDIEGIL
ncbi:hypothetical protein [Acanthamoeba polyphaga mimivirus]|uniref:Uncharacterized protein n=2 Tax=Megamimivirinae TaxID=3044648 RepID=A0A2L2DKA4_MIMIV|nr:hypothetical protein CE11_00936 [Megavirus courdo11]AVG46580.1 hypothetical protein [Acanthamoeba polyphaga mimivirus]